MVDRISTLAYVAEVGGVFVSTRLLDDLAVRLPGIWAISCRMVLPLLLILAWRYWAGGVWNARNLGIVKPSREGWREFVWLVCFQTAYLLAVLLTIAHLNYYAILGFLVTAREKLNGYDADYGPFIFAIALFAAIHVAWGGELLCRGLAQGLGTIRATAAAGAISAWFAFGAMAVTLALKSGYGLIPDAALWGLFALFPGPLCEAFYFCNRSLLPLMAARSFSCSMAFAGVGFYLYWYPDRSFSTALPIMWGCLVALALTTVMWARRLYPLWNTTLAMIRIGAARGSLMGLGVAAIIVIDRVIGRDSISLVICLAALVMVRVLRVPSSDKLRAQTG